MADPTPTSIQQNLPSPYIQGALTALSERLLPLLDPKNAINTASYAQQVAPETQLQQQARGMAGGLGDYQQYLNQAQQYSGPQAYQQFMSPYQQEVINTTLTEFDKQRQQAMAGQNAQAVASGAFGGAREGVQRAEYGAQTLQDRSALQAQLLQQGFGQAQQAAQTAFNQQQGLASLQPQLAGQEAQQLGALGTQMNAYQQAVVDAQSAAAKEAAFEPYTRYGLVGQQLTGLVGGFPTQVQTYQQQAQPASPLQQFLGAGIGLGSLAKGIFG